MLFSRLRLVAANSRAWISPWEQLSVQWLLVGRQADLAMARSPHIRLWVSPWRIWSLPISLTRGPSKKVVEERWPGDCFQNRHPEKWQSHSNIHVIRPNAQRPDGASPRGSSKPDSGRERDDPRH